MSSLQWTQASNLGTPVYSAPEMLSGEEDGHVARASRSTDIYALGLLMYEVLTRRKPYEGIQNIGQLAIKVGYLVRYDIALYLQRSL